MKHLSQSNLSSREQAIKHWQRVMETPGLINMSYEYAQAALKTLGRPWREPGEDE